MPRVHPARGVGLAVLESCRWRYMPGGTFPYGDGACARLGPPHPPLNVSASADAVRESRSPRTGPRRRIGAVAEHPQGPRATSRLCGPIRARCSGASRDDDTLAGSFHPQGLALFALSTAAPSRHHLGDGTISASNPATLTCSCSTQEGPGAGSWGRWRYRRRGASWETWPRSAGPLPWTAPPLGARGTGPGGPRGGVPDRDPAGAGVRGAHPGASAPSRAD